MATRNYWYCPSVKLRWFWEPPVVAFFRLSRPVLQCNLRPYSVCPDSGALRTMQYILLVLCTTHTMQYSLLVLCTTHTMQYSLLVLRTTHYVVQPVFAVHYTQYAVQPVSAVHYTQYAV